MIISDHVHGLVDSDMDGVTHVKGLWKVSRGIGY
jgi:hypothetical protein